MTGCRRRNELIIMDLRVSSVQPGAYLRLWLKLSWKPPWILPGISTIGLGLWCSASAACHREALQCPMCVSTQAAAHDHTTLAWLSQTGLVAWPPFMFGFTKGDAPCFHALPFFPPTDNRAVGSKMPHVPGCAINALFCFTLPGGMMHYQRASSTSGQALASKGEWPIVIRQCWELRLTASFAMIPDGNWQNAHSSMSAVTPDCLTCTHTHMHEFCAGPVLVQISISFYPHCLFSGEHCCCLRSSYFSASFVTVNLITGTVWL